MKLSVPKRAHPLVRFLFATMIREQTTLREVAKRSGVHRETISGWRYSRQPDLENLAAALLALGYEIRAVPTEKLFLEDRLRAAGIEIVWISRPDGSTDSCEN
jgi:transcriptional regulator with XRE-family HTH domain